MSQSGPTNEARRRPDWAAVAIGVGLGILAALVAVNTAGLSGGAYTRVGPEAFPYAMAIALAGLSLWTIIEALRGDFPERDHDEVAPIIWIVGGLAAQLLLLESAGFSIATGILFGATARAFGRGPLWMTVPIGILVSLAVWALFTLVLKLSLPAGPLENLIR
ncbi:C4-dicarboxylate ABC transporter [Aureimonas sp. SA4125]|uniref:tripartite tricarboxylate transporter TctB family protein n=1 Tax=Aureimonas sp. SA4125 TaxID=2826993 RepID=UPI001CC33BF3|nr:tripartite tricarboxylate transporter TctB family protein [Aureimonas sp. SA4125]BDA82888.1 C4-dicarboxylate ABC transporter [Aureimonas sp. SA4125]